MASSAAKESGIEVKGDNEVFLNFTRKSNRFEIPVVVDGQVSPQVEYLLERYDIPDIDTDFERTDHNKDDVEEYFREKELLNDLDIFTVSMPLKGVKRILENGASEEVLDGPGSKEEEASSSGDSISYGSGNHYIPPELLAEEAEKKIGDEGEIKYWDLVGYLSDYVAEKGNRIHPDGKLEAIGRTIEKLEEYRSRGGDRDIFRTG